MSGSGISWAMCKSAPRSRQITMPAPNHSVFYRPDAVPAAQPTASKHWRHEHWRHDKCKLIKKYLKTVAASLLEVVWSMKKAWCQATGWSQCVEFSLVLWHYYDWEGHPATNNWCYLPVKALFHSKWRTKSQVHLLRVSDCVYLSLCFCMHRDKYTQSLTWSRWTWDFVLHLLWKRAFTGK